MLYTRAIVLGVANHTNNSFAPFLLECLHLENPNGPSLQRSVRTSSLSPFFFCQQKEVSEKQKSSIHRQVMASELVHAKSQPCHPNPPFTTMRGCSLPFVNLCFQPFRLSATKLTGRYQTPHFPSCTIFQSYYMPQLTRKMNNLAAVPTIASVTACSSRRGAKQLIKFSNGSMFIAAAFEIQRPRILT